MRAIGFFVTTSLGIACTWIDIWLRLKADDLAWPQEWGTAGRAKTRFGQLVSTHIKMKTSLLNSQSNFYSNRDCLRNLDPDNWQA